MRFMKRIRRLDSEKISEELFFNILECNSITEEFCISKELLRSVGGINKGLGAKRIYEVMLRLADKYALVLEDVCIESRLNVDFLDEEDCILKENSTDDVEEAVRTDCYIIAKYKEKLLAANLFNTYIEKLLSYCTSCQVQGLQEKAVALLEAMLLGKEEYYRIDRQVQPILIYKGEDICHNVLNVFAEQLGMALERQGGLVEYFDPEEEGIQEVTRYIGGHYRAIIGMQTYLFSVKMADEQTYLHNLIDAPKYNFIFDHPVWMKSHLMGEIVDYAIFTHDENYVKFIEKYYEKRAYLFPPAGMQFGEQGMEKIYDISFVGTYGDYWQEIIYIHQMDRKYRFLANRLLLELRQNPNRTVEDAFGEVLTYYHIEYTKDEFLELLYQMRRVIYCVTHYYRYRVMKTLLEAGLQVDVFGDSWQYCPLRSYGNLICHPNVDTQESLRVFALSKMSLNIMSWHKAGFTERMANILLAGSVLITDNTAYLKGRFEDQKDMLIFDLEEIENLPDKLKVYLEKEECREQIAQSGWKKAIGQHTWDCRAEELLNYITEDAICQRESKSC